MARRPLGQRGPGAGVGLSATSRTGVSTPAALVDNRKEIMSRLTKTLGAISAALLGVSLAACGSSSSGGESTDDPSGSSASGDKTITLGFIPSWTDGLSTAYLLKDQLGKIGYTVEMKTLTEPAPLYAGLAGGDVDIYPSAWSEVTHKAYMEEFGDKLEDLGAYYENAKLTVAVPDYVDITSIEDLKANADRFGGRIVGIEAGAGLTKAVQEDVIPQYGLADSYELVTSSTPAMLAELKKATDAEKDIVVTLWRPYWANTAFKVKDLKDPKGALGSSEALHFLATKGFGEKYPDAAELIGGIKLDDAQYGSLEDMVVNEYGEGKEAEAITAWLEANPEAFDTQK